MERDIAADNDLKKTTWPQPRGTATATLGGTQPRPTVDEDGITTRLVASQVCSSARRGWNGSGTQDGIFFSSTQQHISVSASDV